MRVWGVSACLCALLALSRPAMEYAREAARVFASGVMPALLPMMVLCRMLPVSAKSEHSGFPWAAALLGWMSGSPASAQRARRLMACGGIAPHQAEKLLALTGVMSPMFFTGTLAGWLGSARTGWMMLAAHWLGAALTAAVWRARPCGRLCAPEVEAPASLPEAVSQSARALLAVCGAMMLFSAAAGMLKHAFAALFPAWAQRHGALWAVLWAMLETGGGARALIEVHPDPALLCGLCSFGGLSIWLQNLLFVGESIRPARLLGMRLLHGAAGYVICYFFLKIQNLLMT